MTKSKTDTVSAICPHCEHPHYVEPADYDDQGHLYECEKCEKEFWVRQEFSVTHHTWAKVNP